MSEETKDLTRYARQVRFAEIGESGQARISSSSGLLVGCGALGTVIADQLVRAGVGELRIVDRDIPEMHNLQRQSLFTEQDVLNGIPKAEAAKNRLKEVNSQVVVKAFASDFNSSNCERLADGVDFIIDGTDNFETRQLINDLALFLEIPWVYGGAIGREGMVKAVVPGQTSCFRCLMGDVPPPGDMPTCETAGIIAPTSTIVASFQVSLALQILAGHSVDGSLFTLDSWVPAVRKMSVPRKEDCPACVKGELTFLQGKSTGRATVLCGQDTVQVLPASDAVMDLDAVAQSLHGLGQVTNRIIYLHFIDGTYELSIFPDGRCLVRGTEDEPRARAIVAKYLGG